MKHALFITLLAGLLGLGSSVMVQANDQAHQQALQQQKKKTAQSLLKRRSVEEQAAADAAKKSTNNVVTPRDPSKPDTDWPYASLPPGVNTNTVPSSTKP